MTRPFGMWIDRVEAVPPQGQGLVLLGPMVGQAPRTSAALFVRRLAAEPVELRFRGTAHFRRDSGQNETGLVVSGWYEPAASLAGTLLHEAGATYLLLKTLLLRRHTELLAPARFDLQGTNLQGFIWIQGPLLDLHVLGGEAVTPEDFRQRLVRIVTPEGFTLTASDLVPPRQAQKAAAEGHPPRPFPALRVPWTWKDDRTRQAS